MVLGVSELHLPQAACDVCDKRCAISMEDGNKTHYPVCNNGQLYDALHLKAWIDRQPGQTVQVIPGVDITDVVSARYPLQNLVRRLYALPGCAPHGRRAVHVATQTDAPLPVAATEALAEIKTPSIAHVTRSCTRRLPRYHPFPRAVVKNAPAAVCAFHAEPSPP